MEFEEGSGQLLGELAKMTHFLYTTILRQTSWIQVRSVAEF